MLHAAAARILGPACLQASEGESVVGAVVQLWLPILLSAVAIFIVSSLIHMVFKWHNSTYHKLGEEDAVRAAIRASGAQPGMYVLPHCTDMKDMQDPAIVQKMKEGPVGFLTLRPPGPPAMGASLLQWFLFTLAVAAGSAAITVQAVGLGAGGHVGAHMIGLISLMAYAMGGLPEGIWMGRPWKSVALHALDGLIYATVSAIVFMLLWPTS